MFIPKIQKTKDYSIFKVVNFNREKNAMHIERLKNIITEENLLPFHPIIVNDAMEVIDGQHRLQAAKELGIEIYYVVGDVSYSHILNANLVQKKGSIKDAIRFYAFKDDKEDYKELLELMKRLEVETKALFGLLLGVNSQGIVALVNKGKFKLPSNKEQNEMLVEYYVEFLKWAIERKVTPLSMFKSAYFTTAFRVLVINGISREVFYNKLSMKWFDLKPQANIQQWIDMLVSIYNFKNQAPIKVL